MSEKIVKIRGIDSLLFRDGRPFGNEPGALAARSLPIPMPGTVAGFLRTHLGNKAGWDWEGDGPCKAVGTPVAGPLLIRNSTHVFPAPSDAVVCKAEGAEEPTVMCLRPYAPPDGSGCDLPEGLQPLKVTVDAKPESGYNFWSWSDLERWLHHSDGDDFAVPDKIEGLMREERVHVAICDTTGVSEDGNLYTVEYRSFEQYQWDRNQWTTARRDEWSLLAKLETDEAVNLTGAGLLGGEKRVAYVEETDRWLDCPPTLKEAIGNSRRVRMVLATPAIFAKGWKPKWLDAHLKGSPPGANGVTLRLVSAAVKRREAVSGWDYRSEHFGPKPVRWLAPAGSVYFFEVESGDAGELVECCWLKPVNDNPQDNLDGYGLALWGIW